jgi:predicted transcriptional regulator
MQEFEQDIPEGQKLLITLSNKQKIELDRLAAQYGRTVEFIVDRAIQHYLFGAAHVLDKIDGVPLVEADRGNDANA